MTIKKTYKPLLLLLLVVLLAMSGCGAEKDVQNTKDAGQPFQLTLTDDLGREVCLERKPERIVSLAPSNTEMLFALGLDEQIVGVSEHCNYPAAALEKAKAGTFSEPNLELIVSLNPHLVVAGHFHEEKLARLEELGIPVLVLNPSTVEEIYASLELLGEAAQVEENAHRLVAQMRERMRAVEQKMAHLSTRRRVYYEVYADPLMSVGRTSVIHELIEIAGGYNIFADVEAPYPKITAEAVVDRDPEVIIFPNYHGTEGVLANEIIQRPGWESISAIKNERVVGVSPDKFSRPGPRVVEAVEELAAILYPEIK
ncbi:MAG: cobalamin-binding protein [Bacillota bacterium]